MNKILCITAKYPPGFNAPEIIYIGERLIEQKEDIYRKGESPLLLITILILYVLLREIKLAIDLVSITYENNSVIHL